MITDRDHIRHTINAAIEEIIEKAGSGDYKTRNTAYEDLVKLVDRVYEAGVVDGPDRTAYLKAEMALLKKDAVWIGEDGAMACVAPNPKLALAKFKRFYRSEVGELEAEELQLEAVCIGYVRMVPLTDMHESDWAVYFSKKDQEEKNGYMVYVYNA